MAFSLSLFDYLPIVPEMILAAWGLFLLAFDVLALRRRSGRSRNLTLGVIGIVGAILALVATFVPELAGLGGVEESLFGGTLIGGPLMARLNALLILVLIGVLALSTVWDFTEHWGEYYALVLWAAVGMMFLMASEDLLTLFLTLETMTICLYIITAFEKGKRRSAEGGLKYFVYGSVSSALFLFGLSLIYGLTGSTRLESIGRALSGSSGLGGDLAGALAVLLVLVGFGFKISAVPFHQWAPDAYEGAPAPVTAWLATGSKLASVVALMKVLTQALGPWAHGAGSLTSPGWVGLVAVISGLTMTYGNFAALAQKNLKRMLAYSSIAHAGYMLVGILAALVAGESRAAWTVLFYLAVYSVANIGAFAVACWTFRDRGSDEIDDLDGLGHRYPVLGVCVLLLMLSLIGLPGLAGFFGKLFMFSEALNQGDDRHRLTFLWLIGLGLFNSVVSAFYYVRVLRAMFLRPSRGPELRRPGLAIGLCLAASTAVVVVFGLYPTPLQREAVTLSDSRMFAIGGRGPKLVRADPTGAAATPIPSPPPTRAETSAPPAPTPLLGSPSD